MTLIAYFDDSGKFDDPNETVNCVGGCIASNQAWDLFKTEWAQALRRFGISQLHMRTFAHSVGEFNGWEEIRRREFLQALIEVMCRHVKKPIGAVLPLSQYDELTPDQKANLPDPYLICFQDCAHAVGLVAKELFDPEETVQLVFAKRPKGDAMVRRDFELCKQQLPTGDRLISVEFDTPQNALPLQVADLVAYELTQLGRDMLDPSSSPLETMRWPMQQLVDKFFPEIEFYTTQRLIDRVPPDSRTS